MTIREWIERESSDLYQLRPYCAICGDEESWASASTKPHIVVDASDPLEILELCEECLSRAPMETVTLG